MADLYLYLFIAAGLVGVCIVYGIVYMIIHLFPRLSSFMFCSCLAGVSGMILYAGLSTEISFVRHATPVVARVVSSPGVHYVTKTTIMGRHANYTRVETYPHEMDYDGHRTTTDLGRSFPVGTQFAGFYNKESGSDLRLGQSKPEYSDLFFDFLSWRFVLLAFFLAMFLLMSYCTILSGIELFKRAPRGPATKEAAAEESETE